ncbi:MAG: hypothetical protein GXP25_23115 [Planctomycetes bacterium]|nr:hypothetical protein [Planctomycetota bacterium]
MRLFAQHTGRVLFDVCEESFGPPSCTPQSKWIGGIVVPLALAFYGLCCCLAQRAIFFNTEQLVLNGNVGVAFGILWISAGVFAHSHYFWGSLDRLHVFSEPGKVISLTSLIFSVLYMMFSWLAVAYR